MTVEVNDADWPVCPGHTSEQGKCDRVVTAKGNDARQSLALQRKTFLIAIGVRSPHQQVVVSFLNLFDSISVVIADSRRCISAFRSSRRVHQMQEDVLFGHLHDTEKALLTK